MGEYIDKVISSDNATLLLDTDNNPWCEIMHHGNMCKFTLFNQNIPIKYRGKDVLEVFERVIFCDSNEQAELCKQELILLIYNGYKSDFNWYLPLDIEDLMKIFKGVASRYFHYSTGTSNMNAVLEDINAVLEEIQGKTYNSKTLFIYIQANLDLPKLLSIYEEIVSSITIVCDDFCGQISKNDAVESGQISIDVWYN